MADIFISYAREDRASIEKLAASLEAEGFSTWWDRHIAGGAEFSKDIEKELNAAQAVIVAWSKHANDSRWVKDEAGLAAEAGKLVAVSLDGSDPPIGFKQFHVVDYQIENETAVNEVARSVAMKLDRPAPEIKVATNDQPDAASRRKRTLIIFTTVAALLAVVMLGLQFFRVQNPTAPEEATASADSQTSNEVADAEYNSIAVLAFADLSPDRDQEYFSDGIAEELLNLLAKNTDLRVAARTSSFAFKGRDQNVSEIGSALNVDTVLEGSVRKAGDRVRITAQLIDARTGFHLWSETYDRELADVFAVQDEIAGAIVNSLPTVAGNVGTLEAERVNNEAYDLYLQGRHQLTLRTRATIEAAKDLFERSLAIEPDYAPAWAELAMSALLLSDGQATYGELTVEEVRALAEPAVERALTLDPGLAEAHVAQGFLLGHLGGRPGSIASYRKAIELNPSVANARHLLYLTLFDAGEFAEAFEVIDRAVALDPLSAVTVENHVSSLSARGRFEDALAAAKRLYSLHPNWPHSSTALARAYAANGEFAKSVALMERAADATGGNNLDEETAWNLLNLKMFDHPRVKNASVHPASFLAVTQGRYNEARSLAMRNFENNPQRLFAAWRALWTLWAIGEYQAALDFAEAYAAAQQGVNDEWAVRPGSCYPGIYIAGLRQRSGDREGAQSLIGACRAVLSDAERQGRVLAYFEKDMPVELLVLEGRHDEALSELRRLTDSGRFISWWIGSEPIYEPVRDDPRFQSVVADLNARAEKEGEHYLTLKRSDSPSESENEDTD